jgi:hypothetical protein
MAEPRFDAANSVKFDLGRGQVELEGGARLLVPVDALLAVCRGLGQDSLRDFGRRLGTEAGRRVADRISVKQASLDAVIDHLGGELALIGIGSLGAERWGRALVLTLDDSPLGADGDALVAAILEGALQRSMARDANIVRLDRKEGRVRWLVVNAKTAEKTRQLLSQGVAWGNVLARLHSSRGEA